MPTEVVSPVTRKGSKVSGNEPCSSPGARSMPGAERRDSVPPQPQHGGSGGRIRAQSEEPASPLEPRTQVTGPEE
jgi:hypothetical protein